MNKVVIYTAITNGYDELKDPDYVSDNFDYICFTDNKSIKSDVWQIRHFENSDLDPVRKCREVKVLPHKYFKQYDYSVWIDGNIEITGDINQLLKELIIPSKLDFFTFRHPFRNCVYEEAEECIRQGKDNAQIIKHQLQKYINNHFPEQTGLVESNVIIRKHNSKKLVKVLEDWWQEINDYSRRDQLSFNYVAWLNDFQYGLLKGSSRGDNNYFSKNNHKLTPDVYMKRLRNKIFNVLRLDK